MKSLRDIRQTLHEAKDTPIGEDYTMLIEDICAAMDNAINDEIGSIDKEWKIDKVKLKRDAVRYFPKYVNA